MYVLRCIHAFSNTGLHQLKPSKTSYGQSQTQIQLADWMRNMQQHADHPFVQSALFSCQQAAPDVTIISGLPCYSDITQEADIKAFLIKHITALIRLLYNISTWSSNVIPVIQWDSVGIQKEQIMPFLFYKVQTKIFRLVVFVAVL